MDLAQTLKNDLDHLEASLGQLKGVESEQAGAGDLPFVHFGLLALSSKPEYSKVRDAFEDTFDPELKVKTKLGGDWGACLLVITVRKLLEVGELDSRGRMHQALSWIATVQAEVDKIVPSASSSSAFKPGDVVLAPYPDLAAWPSLVVDPSKAPQKQMKGSKSASSVLVAWMLNVDELDWRKPSELSALTPSKAQELLKTKSAQPKNAHDKKNFVNGVKTFLDDKKLQQWKEELKTVLEERWLKELGVETVEDNDAALVKLVCCSRPWNGQETLVACDKCAGWEHTSCLKYVCPSCTKEAG
ncbi:hypothetical protein BCR35DRAFT_314459 [Leucosporidium creatinivorum]|uniref:PWWP domain-containing protein n=1 Tax=Leucosporidium creatinivorum TaxID=106004 RepID=A0A1Y2EY54_9BASI|nr:hypothetical protein BCR35DRAFT_314459 [Leucosporidium creatinivorum]